MGGGPPVFLRDFSSPVVLRRASVTTAYLSPTRLSLSLVRRSRRVRLDILTATTFLTKGMMLPIHPYNNAVRLLHCTGLGCFPFARRYLGNRCCFLLLRLLRCFSSPGIAPYDYLVHHTVPGSLQVGSPIRTPTGRCLLTARRGVSPLAASFFASWRLGIHRVPFLP